MFAGAIHLFMCHQKDGHLCAGWVAAHGPQELLAIRLNSRKLHKSVFTYKTDIPVFKSGSEALRHGIRDLHDPNARARRLMAKLIEKGKGAVE
jgi:hypothetical protein